MTMTRRAFVVMTAGTAAGVSAGCAASTRTTASYVGPIDIGTTADYPYDGVYDQFSRYRFFVVRRSGQLTALSAICPHRRCTVRFDAGKGFICPCHGAMFDHNGRVTRGPATSDLSSLPVTVTDSGHLLVQAE
jgi:cytochrome b6-f complex iron-sulfur subunit